MENFVPYEKLSKKKKRDYNNKRRQTWDDFSTRSIESKKEYKRKQKFDQNYRDLENFVEDEEFDE